jgi:hypothetical protein
LTPLERAREYEGKEMPQGFARMLARIALAEMQQRQAPPLQSSRPLPKAEKPLVVMA